MSNIPDTHPRARSLRLRDRLVEGFHSGIVTETGLVAQGRGEAFDYLLGEQTCLFAERALNAATAAILTANHPVITVNGNVVALAGPELVELAEHHPRLRFEVNIFHYTPARAQRIVSYLRELGLVRIMEFGESSSPLVLTGTDSLRRFMHPEGVGRADVVFVALEDGDRCKALVESGRTVVAVDLNPLSRTAQMAQITIVDELTRVLPLLDRALTNDETTPRDVLKRRLAEYDNQLILADSIRAIRSGFSSEPTNDPARCPTV